jgi:hypothetical protein
MIWLAARPQFQFRQKKARLLAGLLASSADLSAEHAGRIDDASGRKQRDADQS